MEAGHVGDFFRNDMILFLATRIGGTTGGPSANLDILTSISATGHPVGIITFQQAQTPRNEIKEIIPNIKFTYQFQRHNWPPSKKEKELICSKLNSFDIRLVISNDLAFHNLFHFAILPNIKTNFKTVVISHTQPNHYPFSVGIKEVLKRYNKYNHFISVSKRVLEEWKHSGLNLPEENYHFIHNCCNERNAERLNKYSKKRIRNILGIKKDTFIAVCVASMQTRKNQTLILNSLDKITSKYRKTLFYFIGKNIPHKGGDKIINSIVKSPFKSNIIWLGELDDAMPYIRSADILILPSLGEVMPLTILEAFSLRTTVLASNVGGIPEMIENGKNGILFEPSKTNTYVESFNNLRENKELRLEMAENAYKLFHKRFNQRIHIKSWGKLINKLMKD